MRSVIKSLHVELVDGLIGVKILLVTVHPDGYLIQACTSKSSYSSLFQGICRPHKLCILGYFTRCIFAAKTTLTLYPISPCFQWFPGFSIICFRILENIDLKENIGSKRVKAISWYFCPSLIKRNCVFRFLPSNFQIKTTTTIMQFWSLFVSVYSPSGCSKQSSSSALNHISTHV